MFLGCESTNIADSRDYVINIENANGLVIDSIIVARTIDGATDTLKFLRGDAYDGAGAIAVDFPISAELDAQVDVSYRCYSYGIPVVEKGKSFTFTDENPNGTGGVNPKIVQLLLEYQGRVTTDTIIDSTGQAQLLDSLFVGYVLKEDTTVIDSTISTLFETYSKKEGVDIASFVVALKDSLTGRGDAAAAKTLEGLIGVSEVEIMGYVALNTDTTAQLPDPVGVSSSSAEVGGLSSAVGAVSSSSVAAVVVGDSTTFTFHGVIDAHATDVATVFITLSGDNIVIPVVKQAAYDAELTKYTGFIKQAVVGTNYSVEIKVYGALGHLTGYKQKAFTNLSFDVEVAPFDAWNSKPWVQIDSLVDVSIKDSIELKYSAKDTLDGGAVVSVEWKHGVAGVFVAQVDSVFSIRVPDTANVNYPVYVRVMDGDSNVVLDSVVVRVLLDEPEVSLVAELPSVTKADSLVFNWTGSDAYGDIVSYSFREVYDNAWTSMGLATTRKIQNPGSKGAFKYALMAVDDDNNVVIDTVEVAVVNSVPVAIPDTFSIKENQTAIVGTVFSIDADNEQQRFTLKSGDSNVFSVGVFSGVVEVKEELDYEIQGRYSLIVTVSDGDDSVDVKVDINVGNENDNAPEFVIGDRMQLDMVEDIDSVFSLSFSDADGDTVVWRLIEGPDSATVMIDGMTGVISYVLKENANGVDSLKIEIDDGVFRDIVVLDVRIEAVDDPPEYTGSPSISGADYKDSVLTVSPRGTCIDLENPSAEFSYQWYRDSSDSGNNGVAISGEQNLTYTLTSDDVGEHVYVLVTCSDGVNSVSNDSKYTGVILDTPQNGAGMIIDGRDGEEYDIISIGTQVWFAENLNYSGDDDNGNKTFSTGYCYGKLDHTDSITCDTYGRLYDWRTAMKVDFSFNTTTWPGSDIEHQGICPNGWHLPSDDEWSALSNFVESTTGSNEVARRLKSTDTWADNGSGTDDYGFSALPAGRRNYYDGEFVRADSNTEWWSATQRENSTNSVYTRTISHKFNTHIGGSNMTKSNDYSVRCVQDP